MRWCRDRPRVYGDEPFGAVTNRVRARRFVHDITLTGSSTPGPLRFTGRATRLGAPIDGFVPSCFRRDGPGLPLPPSSLRDETERRTPHPITREALCAEPCSSSQPHSPWRPTIRRRAATTRTITGRVVAEGGSEPLAGATVQIVGTHHRRDHGGGRPVSHRAHRMARCNSTCDALDSSVARSMSRRIATPSTSRSSATRSSSRSS